MKGEVSEARHCRQRDHSEPIVIDHVAEKMKVEP